MTTHDAEIDLEALTPVVEEVDHAVQRLVQRAVNGVLEDRGLHWLDDAWFAAVIGVVGGLMRVVGVMPPESQAMFWQTVISQAEGIKAMQARIFQSRLDGTLIPKDIADA